jgi:hypothetical protein
MPNNEKELLVSFTVLNKKYGNPCLRFIRGLQDANSGGATPTAGTIDNPRSTGIPMLSTVVDPKIKSFIYNGEARFLEANVVTPVSGHDGENTTFSLIAAPTPPYGCWSALARDIILQYPARNAAPVATNPQGVAQTRGLLRIIDWDTQKLYTVGTDELNGLSNGSRFTLTEKPFDVAAAIEAYIAGGGTGVPLPPNAKGQAIISIKDANKQRYLFLLYNISEVNAEDDIEYYPAMLIRLKVDADGVITYDAQTYVGLNAVEIIPVTNSDGVTYLLIPAIGGLQQGGATNGGNSDIRYVPAFGTWGSTATALLKGDDPPYDPENPTYDIRAIAASDRANGEGVVYILTGIFNSNNYNGFNWKLYKTTVDKIIDAEEESLSDAESDEIITVAEKGQTLSPDLEDPYGIYFWDILYESSDEAASDAKDRLYFFKGSAIQITPAAAYPDPANPPAEPSVANEDAGAVQTDPGRILFDLGVRDGRIGGYNIDSADLSAETLRQYRTGVSLKRGATAVHVTASGVVSR